MRYRNGFIIGFVIVAGFITWDEVAQCHELPWPPRYIGAAIVFGLLYIFTLVSAELAGVMAVGFALATAVQTLTPAAKRGSNTNFFQANCQHAEGTAQPSSFQALQQPGSALA